MTSTTIFQKIINGEIPCEKLYEDDLCLAFNDISAQAPIHYLVIPKKTIPSLRECKNIDKNLLRSPFLILNNFFIFLIKSKNVVKLFNKIRK